MVSKENPIQIQLRAVAVPRNLYYWSHPNLDQIDPLINSNEERDYTEFEWELMQESGNIDIQIQYIDMNSISAIRSPEDWTGWQPRAPSKTHFLICAYPYGEKDIVLWWAQKRS